MLTHLIRRRDFMRLSLMTGAATWAGIPVFDQAAAADCSAAGTHSERTLDALADTFIPRTPDSPGAVETCARDVILDPSYRFNLSLPVVVTGLDGLAVL